MIPLKNRTISPFIFRLFLFYLQLVSNNLILKVFLDKVPPVGIIRLMKKILLLIPVLFLLTSCTSKKEISVEESTQEKVFTLKSELFASTVTLTGNVEAKKQIPITSKIVGRIDRLFVDVGDRVKKGQILARYSTMDNENEIAFQNAIQSVRATKSSSENTVKSAEINLETTKKAFYQIKKEQDIAVKKAFDSLVVETENTKTILTNTIGFLDQTMGVSPRFKRTSTVSNTIGRQNMIGKHALKNQIDQLIREFTILSQKTKAVKKEAIIKNAQDTLAFLKKTKLAVQNFDKLIRGTVVSSTFSEDQKKSWQSRSQNLLNQLDRAITQIKNGINAAKIQQEQSSVQILSAQNQVENKLSQLSLSKSVAQNQIISAQSQLNLAATFKKELVVRAPFAGVITDKLVDQGQLITPGQTFLKLADISGFKIKTDIPDNQLQNIELDTEVEIQVDGLEETFTGKITKINPAVDVTTRKIGIEVTFNSENTDRLKIGLFARITLKGKPKKTFFIPKSFIQYGFDKTTVVLEDGTEKVVQLGVERNNKIAITFEGITENLKIKS